MPTLDGNPIPGAGVCAVPGCGNRSARGQLCCGACWRRVSPETRRAVGRKWRLYQAGRLGLDELRKAQEQAVREAEQ